MNRLRTAAGYIVTALLAVVVGLGIYGICCERLAGNSVPMPFGIGVACVLSGSMEPTYSVGDLLIIRQEDDLVAGDPVCYQTIGSPVVHRIVFLSEGVAICQGDANDAADSPISVDDIKGKVVLCIPAVGYLAYGLKSPYAILAIAILAIVVIEASFRRTRNAKRRELERLREDIEALSGKGA